MEQVSQVAQITSPMAGLQQALGVASNLDLGSLTPALMPTTLVSSPLWGPNTPSNVSDAGVRYSDGSVTVTSDELSSNGFGSPWGQTLIWTNNAAYTQHNFMNGTGMVIAQLPYVVQVDANDVVVIMDGTDAEYFQTTTAPTRTSSLARIP